MRLKSKEKSKTLTSRQEITRILVKGTLQCGLSVPATAKKLGVSKNLVYRVKRRGTAKRVTGSGRPSKLTSSAKITITKLNKEKLGSSVRVTAKKLKKKGINVSHMTVQRYIAKQSWGTSYTPQKRPVLTSKNIEDRLLMVDRLERQGYLKPRAWRNRLEYVMFTDEVPLYLFNTVNRHNTRFRTSDVTKVPTSPAKQCGGGHIMAYAGLTCRGLTQLFFVHSRESIDQQLYINEMLPNYLSAAKELYGMDWRKVKLQEDGASAHKAKACGVWMKDNWPGGVLLDHDTKNFH